jgi:hypothetical protein
VADTPPREQVRSYTGNVIQKTIAALTPDSKIRFLFLHMTNGRDKSLIVIFSAVSCPSFLEARFCPRN